MKLRVLEKEARWGKDPLTDLLDKAHQATVAFFATPRPQAPLLRIIERTFRAAIVGLEIRDEKDLQNLPIRGFFLMSHGSFVASVRLMTAGQLAEAYMLMRGTVERAVYAWYLATHVEAFDIWRKRHEGADALKLAKRELKISWMLKCLAEAHPEVGRLTSWLYEESIDYGGHPNPADYLSGMHAERTEEQAVWGRKYLNTGSVAADDCGWNTVVSGACSLAVFRLIYPDRFAQAGVSEELARILNAIADWDEKRKRERKAKVADVPTDTPTKT